MVRLLFCTWYSPKQAFAQVVPGNSGCDLEMQFSIVFYWLISSCLLMILAWDECHGTLLMINQHWFRSIVRMHGYVWNDSETHENAWACVKWQWNARDCVTGLHDWRSWEWVPLLNLFGTKLLHFTLNKMCNICKSNQHKTGFFLVFLYTPLLIVIPVTGICNTFCVTKTKRTSKHYIFVMQSTIAPVWS